MKLSKWSLALVFGWFFAVQSVTDDNIGVLTIVGPFQSERECKAKLEEITDTFEQMGVEAKFVKCRYKQET